MYYESLKHAGRIPIIGVNTFLDPHGHPDELSESIELSRATRKEKESQIHRLSEFQKKNSKKASAALKQLKKVVLSGGNIFAELMDTVKVCSLGEITNTLYDVGGKYRRNM